MAKGLAIIFIIYKSLNLYFLDTVEGYSYFSRLAGVPIHGTNTARSNFTIIAVQWKIQADCFWRSRTKMA